VQLSGPGYGPQNRQVVTLGGAGGGITSVASLPATCTPGVTAPVSLTINGIGYGIFRCIAPNVWAPDDPQQSISPLAYGAKWDVKGVSDASMTITSNTVTCPNANCNFTSADLGKIVFGTTYPNNQNSSCTGAGCGSVIVPQGFICLINNANSINVGTTYPGCAADNATASCTQASSTLCGLVWGTQDDSAAIQSAAAAAWTGTSCKGLQYPSGLAFFTVPAGGLLNVTVPGGGPCGSKILDTTQAGPMVYGQGAGATVLVPLPSTSFANCTGGQSGTACVAGPAGWMGHDWGINGYGQANNGTTHANNLIEFYGFAATLTGTSAWNMAFSTWDQSTGSTSSQGFVLGNSTTAGVVYASNIVSEGFANTPCAVSAASNNTLTMSGMDCFGSSAGTNGASLVVSPNGGTINSTGGQYWGINNTTAASAVLTKGAGGTFNSFSDTIAGSGTAGNLYAVRMNGSGTISVNFGGSKVTMSSSAGSTSPALSCVSQTCNVSVYATPLAAIGASAQLFNNQSGTFNLFDACSNTYTQGGVASSAINIFGGCSITGTPITAAKLVLSAGWGASAAWTALSGATQSIQGTITNTGAGQAANPTITYTFPTPFLQAPAFCSAYLVGGTQVPSAATLFLTPSALSATSVTFTYNGTPTVNLTEVVQILCSNQ
jgi:hypothetical protein